MINSIEMQVTLENIALIGKQIRSKLKKNMILSVNGPLGIGKTTLIKHIFPEFQAQSPSFLHVLYYGENFAHIDAYTFKTQEAFFSLDLPEMLKEKCVVIEWGELIDLNLYDVFIFKVELFIKNEKRFIII